MDCFKKKKLPLHTQCNYHSALSLNHLSVDKAAVQQDRYTSSPLASTRLNSTLFQSFSITSEYHRNVGGLDTGRLEPQPSGYLKRYLLPGTIIQWNTLKQR